MLPCCIEAFHGRVEAPPFFDISEFEVGFIGAQCNISDIKPNIFTLTVATHCFCE